MRRQQTSNRSKLLFCQLLCKRDAVLLNYSMILYLLKFIGMIHSKTVIRRTVAFLRFIHNCIDRSFDETTVFCTTKCPLLQSTPLARWDANLFLRFSKIHLTSSDPKLCLESIKMISQSYAYQLHQLPSFFELFKESLLTRMTSMKKSKATMPAFKRTKWVLRTLQSFKICTNRRILF